MITQAALKAKLHYDPATGTFKRVDRAVGKRVGSRPQADGYIEVTVNYEVHRAHLLAWLYMTGAFPARELEFVNGNRADIRFDNLRESTHKLNHWKYKKANKQSQSGMLGASPKRNGRWLSQIHANGKTFNLGTFDTAQEAHAAYLEAKKIHHAASPR